MQKLCQYRGKKNEDDLDIIFKVASTNKNEDVHDVILKVASANKKAENAMQGQWETEEKTRSLSSLVHIYRAFKAHQGTTI